MELAMDSQQALVAAWLCLYSSKRCALSLMFYEWVVTLGVSHHSTSTVAELTVIVPPLHSDKGHPAEPRGHENPAQPHPELLSDGERGTLGAQRIYVALALDIPSKHHPGYARLLPPTQSRHTDPCSPPTLWQHPSHSLSVPTMVSSHQDPSRSVGVPHGWSPPGCSTLREFSLVCLLIILDNGR